MQATNLLQNYRARMGDPVAQAAPAQAAHPKDLNSMSIEDFVSFWTNLQPDVQAELMRKGFSPKGVIIQKIRQRSQ